MNSDQFIRYKALDRCFRDNYGSYTIIDLVESCTKDVCDFYGDYEKTVTINSMPTLIMMFYEF